ncbi:unnamed protein product, partial [Diamesa tonsa]
MKKSPKPVDINLHKLLPVSHVSSYEGKKLLEIGMFGGFDPICILQYSKDSIHFHLTSNTFKWTLTKITVTFKETKVDQKYLEVSKPTKQFNVDEEALLMINTKNIFLDLFSDTHDRKFTVVMEFLKNSNQKCISTFMFPLPVIRKQDKWPTSVKPVTVNPDRTTRTICRQNFFMHPSNHPQEIQKCILLEEFKQTAPKDRLRNFGYCEMLKLLLFIEDSTMLDIVEKSNLNNHFIQQVSTMTFKIKTGDKVSEHADQVVLTPMDKVTSPDFKKHQITCRIVGYAKDHVIIEMKRSKEKIIDPTRPYHICFVPNLYSNKIAHAALKTLQENDLENWMLEFDGVRKQPKRVLKKHEQFDWFNKNISTNEEQKLAVKNIVNQTSMAMPFIIFGPPGTGKTSTLVEAVLQIVTLNPSAKVLISVNSNSACDEIGERLLKFLSVNKVHRFYSPSFERKMEKVHPKLKPISNLKLGYNSFATYQEFYSYNVVISTLVNCGRMSAAKIDPNHFDYVFIDECASMAECYAVIPIAVCADNNKISASLVFCGDHKQLGPIFNTHHNDRYGFSITLMERVLLLEEYERDPSYDTELVIKLVKNFRSHHAILEYSNQQFYNDELQACQTPDIANFALGWDLLPNKSFPIIFHSVFAASQQEGTSAYNMTELQKTKYYVEDLLRNGINGQKVKPIDIGIVSPYNAQRTKLQEMIGHKIEIGTVEYYQGREKKIIIFSAVRSQTPTIGFLRNEKRLNVALTRAKSLLIVLGNPETLYRNHYWREFIRYCRYNNGI